MKFKIYMLLPMFILGTVIFNIYNSYMLCLCIIATIVFAVIYFFNRNIIWVFMYLFFVFGGVSLFYHNKIVDNKYEFVLSQREFNGRIVDVKEESITIKNNKVNYKIVFYIPKNMKGKDSFSLGDYIYIEGTLKEKLEYRKNNMASRGVTSYGTIKKVLDINKKTNILNFPLRIKDKVNNGLTFVDKDAGAFVSGLITGYRSSINEDDMEIFNELDIIHIIAVSGFNIAIIYSIVMMLTKKINMKKRLLLSQVFCTVYVFITGFDPSITRAFIMITMVIIGKAIGKKYSTINSLSVAAFFMMCTNPYYIYNLGFILSYLATLSIAIFNNDILFKVQGWAKFLKNDLAATISSMVLTFPIVIYIKGYFSLISILVNAILAPIISTITVVGFISSFIYIIFPLSVIFYPVVFLGSLTLEIVRIFSKGNILFFIGQMSILSIVIYYIIVLISTNIIKFKKGFYKYATIILLVWIIVFQGIVNYNDFKIHFINVGQGDSIFIELPGKKTMLIDTGYKREEYIAAKYKIVPYIRKLGYNKIDYLIISHFHDDHTGGTEYIEENMPIHNKVSYKGSKENEYIGFSKGDKFKLSGVDFNVISPSENISSDDENKNSLIIKVSYKGFNALFTGDATKDEMDMIKGDYDVLKVPHHGSKYSVSETMMENSTFKSAVISVGNNNFGHPTKECIDSLRLNNADIYRTDKHGNIVYSVKTNGYKIKFNN